MPKTLDYDFIPEPFLDPVTKIVRSILRPKILIRINKDKDLIDCLVDSGADLSLLPAHFIEKQGIRLENGIKNQLEGIGDKRIDAYLHKVTLHLEGYSFDTLVNFSEEQSFPLLGREGFFNHFKQVVLDYKSKRLRLVLPEKSIN